MGKIVAIMQPTYMPWLGYFSMIDQVDEFIFLDNVQLVDRSWQVRNKIKFNEKEKMLTIPVDHSIDRNQRYICVAKYVDNDWKVRHLATIKQAYSKARYYGEVFSFLKEIYDREYISLGDFTINLIIEISNKIGIKTVFQRSSQYDISGHKDELLANICRKVDADVYLSAQGSAAYIEQDMPGGQIEAHGIRLLYHNYNHPHYTQMGSQFISHLGIYDLLFNEGWSSALNIIKQGNLPNYTYFDFRKNILGLE